MAKKPISVIERRLQGPSALVTPSVDIPLKETGWVLRWIYSDDHNSRDRAWQVINLLGWQYVEPDDIACNLEEVGARAMDNRVVRGERAREVLVKMAKADFAKIQKKKAAENLRRTFDKQALQQTVLNKTGAEHGGAAADFLQEHATFTTVDHRERVAIDE